MKPLFFALALGSPVFAAATDAPAKEALRFVEKLRDKTLDLAPGHDTALSPATGNDKRKLIEKRIARLSSEVGQGELEAGPGTVDGDMAAVLVRQAAGFDPSRLRVFAIGLIRKGDRWQPAPVPGSFENTGLGYDETIGKRLAALENWMMREQVLDLTNLREKSAGRLREAIAKKLKPDELHESSPELLARRLLSACEKRDQATVLGLLGGLQTELPKDWSACVAAVDEGLSATPKGSPWQLLVAPGVIRTIIEVHTQEGDREATVFLAFLDASGGTGKSVMPKIRIFDFRFVRNEEGLWRIELPEVFYTPSPAEPQEEDAGPKPEDTVLNALPDAWRGDFPLTRIDTAKAAVDHLLEGLSGEAPAELIKMLALDGDAAVARLGVMRLAMIWQDLHQADPRTPILLGFQELGEGAVAAFQMFSSREPERSDLRTFYFTKEDAGWVLAAGLRPADPPPEKLRAAKAWADARAPEWSKNWESLVLAESSKLKIISAGEAPSEVDARNAFETWSSAILKGDPKAAIAFTAHLDRERGPARLLRNIGYELTGARKSGLRPTILGVIRKGCWAAISARVGKPGDSAATYPLYPLVNTPTGPRVLAEIDLFANGTRTRNFLNDASWGRLDAAGDGEASATLREIYEIHRKTAEADRPPAPAP